MGVAREAADVARAARAIRSGPVGAALDPRVRGAVLRAVRRRWWVALVPSAVPLLSLCFAGVIAITVLLPAVGVSTDTRYVPFGIDEGFEDVAGTPFEPAPGARHVWPLPGGAITSPFGWRRHPTLGDVRFHEGVDVGAPPGTAVLAAADGVVVFAGWAGGYGNMIIISHGDHATRYAHLSAVLVGRGRTVAAGEAIGAVGSTGRSAGPHLHFEWRAGGRPVDPLSYYR